MKLKQAAWINTHAHPGLNEKYIVCFATANEVIVQRKGKNPKFSDKTRQEIKPILNKYRNESFNRYISQILQLKKTQATFCGRPQKISVTIRVSGTTRVIPANVYFPCLIPFLCTKISSTSSCTSVSP